MPDELANDVLDENPEPVNWQTRAQEYEAQLNEVRQQHTALEQSYKSVQRELNKARTQGGQTAQLTSKLNAIEKQMNALTAVLSSDLDDEARATISRAQAETEQQERQAQQQQRAAAQIAATLQEAGVTDADDPRLESVLDAWNDGDYAEALREARRVKRAKPAEPAAQVDEIIAAAVDKALRQAGVRRVDTGAGNPDGGNPFRRENLQESLRGMTREEMLRSVTQINEVN